MIQALIVSNPQRISTNVDIIFNFANMMIVSNPQRISTNRKGRH
ncbi:MAG: hypothetical protein MjAS7_2003 [Metallosphaera javensis (ex Sakai et al. 2022)]|nr:MAG: hypothetical protein MjAS7_2003 [Metallosphaera javensis (ex Sakai et al. 2022)]